MLGMSFVAMRLDIIGMALSGISYADNDDNNKCDVQLDGGTAGISAASAGTSSFGDDMAYLGQFRGT